MHLPFLNGLCWNSIKRSSTAFTDGCPMSLNDIWCFTPLGGSTLTTLLITRTFPGFWPFFFRSFESICGRGTAAVPTVHSELSFKFSDPRFKSSYCLYKALDCVLLTLDNSDECFWVMVCQCKDLVTFYILNIYVSLIK
ncbi:MAG: hypothetical protein Q7J09_11050 [Methanocalculus sp.]|uniref:hypothetical protein n=1 Tax=Methanocalculus sp. TaxID=2004547 RepID=UPI002726682E|nr:hypothetical protein [Methanocalculus sp.]MDO9540519.1 hypothetical protein [Methanocalculus sp.]